MDRIGWPKPQLGYMFLSGKIKRDLSKDEPRVWVGAEKPPRFEETSEHLKKEDNPSTSN